MHVLLQVLTLSSGSSACTSMCPRAVLPFGACCPSAYVLDVQLSPLPANSSLPRSVSAPITLNDPTMRSSPLAPPVRGEELAYVVLDDFGVVSLRSNLPKTCLAVTHGPPRSIGTIQSTRNDERDEEGKGKGTTRLPPPRTTFAVLIDVDAVHDRRGVPPFRWSRHTSVPGARSPFELRGRGRRLPRPSGA
ncbi:hypothetical protein C8R45DRAFT_118175 [Mycena sanguinolenta]|nr:hypothetical protein C8R45DRAFT_118175 [Mycena sanguinolenta]